MAAEDEVNEEQVEPTAPEAEAGAPADPDSSAATVRIPEAPAAADEPAPHEPPTDEDPEALAPTIRQPQPQPVAEPPPPADEPAEPQPSPQGPARPQSKPPPRRRRRLRWRYPVVGILLIGALLYVIANGRPWIHDRTVQEARRRGVELELGEVHLDRAHVRVKHFQFSLVDMGGVRGDVEVLQVNHEDLTPTRIEARGVSLELEGSAAALAMSFSEWAESYPELLRIPAKATWVDVVWRPQPGEPEWLRIDDATIEPTPAGGRFKAAKVRVFDMDIGLGDTVIESDDAGASVTASSVRIAGIDLGKVGTTWSGDLSHISLGFGEAELERAPVTIDVTLGTAAPQAKIELKPTKLERLAAPLGVALPVEGVTASGTVDLELHGGPTAGPISGQLQATFEGYSPPVPKEVESFVFGKTTTLQTDLKVSDDRQLVELVDTIVKHGAIVLEGGGRIERHGDHATIALELKGQLSCKELAAAAAQSQVGGLVGGLLGGAARFALQGSVAVRLVIQADSRNLAVAKLDKHIGIGCGLRSLGELPIPKLPIELPELPSFGD